MRWKATEGSGQRFDTVKPTSSQNHFRCCVKDRIRVGAKDGSRDTLREKAQGLDKKASWDMVRNSQIPDIF